MADVKVGKQGSEQRGGGEERRGAIARRSDFPFSLSPREFWNMNPFALMRRFSEEMDRTFSGFGREEFGGWMPAVEVREREGNLIVCAELPGLNKDDVKVEITDEGLVIQGERKREEKEEREGYFRSERSYGQFHRVIPLPDDAKLDEAKANFTNGVLEVSIPVPASKQKRREIPIDTGEKARTSGGGA